MPEPETSLIRASVARLWYRALWRLSPSRVLHGIRTAISAGAVDSLRCFDRLDEALDLLQRHDPATLQDLRRCFHGILVFGTERYRSAYWSEEARLCVLTGRYLETPTLSPHDIALTLVHEGMHARLCALGFPYHDGRRARIEVICAMAELAFARRLPFSPHLTRSVERRIDEWSTSNEVSWSDETLRQAKLDYLRELGTSKWLVGILERISRFVSGRAA